MTFRDQDLGPTAGGSLWQTCPIVAHMDPSVATTFYDEFWTQPSTKASQSGVWTIVEDDGAGGTDAVLDARNGQYKHFCDGDLNDEAYMSTTNEQWIITAGYSIWWEARVAITEGNTNQANFWIGLTDSAGANMIQDGAAGPAASYDGVGFFKTGGALTTVGFETSNAGTQATTTSGWTIASGTFYRYGCWIKTESTSDTVAVCTPYVNGAAGTAKNITISGLAEMEFCIGIKGGAGASEEAFTVDYVKIVQIRN